MPTPKALSHTLKKFQDAYGALVGVAWKLILYPVIVLSLYSGKMYLNEHYVSRPYFDDAIAKVESGQREISVKIDGVLIYNAAAIEKAGNLNERIIRLENWRDASGGKVRLSLTSNP